MLVLSRKKSEAIVVGNTSDDEGLLQSIKITVLEVGRGSVRLGIEAPGSIGVHRLEVWDRINQGRLLVKAS
ncbi:MAG TPA: carbon storage regulator [Planctomycetaceae bacterium]|nr:carbon storage regulator [Planctomycetaceae bacterium]HQZ67456.1 carbon storage regulator [Planctomycetaceae bacterium]